MSAETAKVDGDVGEVLKCKRCGTVWAYRGSAEYKAECPECGTSVVIDNRRMVPVEEVSDVLTGGT